MRRHLSGRTGMVLTFLLGLLIATAGTAGAARLITGKQIKDGSISARDLNKALRDQLAKAGVPGPPGVKGDTGPAGPKGETGSPGPGTLLTAAAAVPNGARFQEVLAIPGLGQVISSCNYSSPDFAVTFKNTSGQTIEWERQAQTSAAITELGGIAPDGGTTGNFSAEGNVTVQVTLPAAGSRAARVAVIRIAQLLEDNGSVCRVSVSALTS